MQIDGYDLTVYNCTGQNIELLGAEAGCTCVKVHGVPQVIQRGGTATLRVDVNPNKVRGAGSVRLGILTDFPESPLVGATIGFRGRG